MKLEEYASRFESSAEDLWCGGERGKGEKSEVVLAGTVLAVTDRYCRIDINGEKYEIDARDVIEIEELPAQDVKGIAGEHSGEKVPRTVLITLDRTAVLCRPVPVQAALLAAAGTWMWVAAPEAMTARRTDTVLGFEPPPINRSAPLAKKRGGKEEGATEQGA